MTDKQIRDEIIKYADIYKNNLESKNILFIFQGEAIEFMETAYYPRNFLHLTGVSINWETVKGSIDFYELATKRQLEVENFKVSNRRIVEDKLEALSQTMSIQKTGKEIGEFYGACGKLRTDKLGGNVFACLGFQLDDTMYIPNTNLKENVRLFSSKLFPILVTLRKNINDEKYSEITHVKKNLDLSAVKLPAEILDKLSDEAKSNLKQEIASLDT